MSDTSHPLVRPPILYSGSILIGVVLDFLWPAAILAAELAMWMGAPLLLAGVLLFVLAVREFRSAGTPIPSTHPSTTIVQSGPYRFSRNPIYLAFTLIHLGIAFWVNSLWLIVTLALTLVVLTFGVIAREERYLARRFGEPYLSYKASVRRWL